MHILLKIQRAQPDTNAAFEAGQIIGALMALAVVLILLVIGIACIMGNRKLRVMPTWLLALGVLTAPGLTLMSAGLAAVIAAKQPPPAPSSASPGPSPGVALLVLLGIPAMWLLYFGMLLAYKILRRQARGAARPETDWRGEIPSQAVVEYGQVVPVDPQAVAAPAVATESSGSVARVKRPSREEEPKADADTPVFARCKSCMGRWKTTIGEAKALEACPKCGASPAPLGIQRA